MLKALADLGGAGQSVEVLAAVGRTMSGPLTEVDKEPLPSNHRMLRWENTAQWARNTMVKEGLIAPVRERSLWEITDSGRAALASSDR